MREPRFPQTGSRPGPNGQPAVPPKLALRAPRAVPPSAIVTLAQLGWNEPLAAAFAPHAALGREPARVTLELKGFAEVTGEAGARLGECTGRFVHDAAAPADFPAVGDWVAVTPRDGDGTRADIHAVLPRRTKFSRQAAGEQAFEQVVAANVDTVFLVSALDANFSLRRIERYLAAAHASGAQPVVLLNKADVCAEPDVRRAEVEAIATGVPVLVVSAQTRRGLKALSPWLAPGATVAFLGPSGVGKSTLINRLLGERAQLTQEVREADAKGRHTTTQRELLVTPGGALVIDTPGMRELAPWVPPARLAAAFADVAALAAQCRFRDCSHITEPGCAVAAALADGRLDPARWQSYERLRRESAYEVRRTDPRAARDTKSAWKKLTKQLRQRVREKSADE